MRPWITGQAGTCPCAAVVAGLQGTGVLGSPNTEWLADEVQPLTVHRQDCSKNIMHGQGLDMLTYGGK